MIFRVICWRSCAAVERTPWILGLVFGEMRTRFGLGYVEIWAWDEEAGGVATDFSTGVAEVVDGGIS